MDFRSLLDIRGEKRDLRSMFLRSLKLERLLSFGPDSEAVQLRPLNVLIGPNGSGKSNFIEAIALLAAAPKDIARAIREGGTRSGWVWQGDPSFAAKLSATFRVPRCGDADLSHSLEFYPFEFTEELFISERLEDVNIPPNEGEFLYYVDSGEPTLYHDGSPVKFLKRNREQSILAQVKGPDYVELDFLGQYYESIRIYREFTFGRRSAARRPQPADLPNDHLMESTENLGLILNKFRRDVPTKKALIEGLKNVFEGITDFSVQVEGGTAQIFLEEEHWTIPATRLSDGTIRWLALLAILLDPKPPPLVCIEEPELGLHPDLMNPLARILKDASERMQIIVTTHSEALVDAFRETPEDVIVCERPAGSTTMRRLDREQLREWLEEYSLGQLWSRGIIGGSRW